MLHCYDRLYGCQRIRLASKHHIRMVNWIIIADKVAVWITRLNKLGDKPLTNALDFIRRRLIGRIKVEYRYFFFDNTVSVFEAE